MNSDYQVIIALTNDMVLIKSSKSQSKLMITQFIDAYVSC